MNGSHYERKLAQYLSQQGYKVVRSPASGGATERDLPDLFYAKPGERPVALELKATSQNVAYYDESEADSLQEFASAFFAYPRLCGRFKGDTSYYLWKIENARVTDSNNYAVDRDITAWDVIEV